MTTTILRACLLTAAFAVLLLAPAIAHAHVSITPRDSTHGATEKYTVRIPTEGKVATTAEPNLMFPKASSSSIAGAGGVEARDQA